MHISNNLSLYGHTDFKIYDNISEKDFKFLMSGIEDAISNGETFKPGETYCIGSIICNIEMDGKYLTVNEPDMKSFPISEIPGIANTISILRSQKNKIELYGLLHLMDFPSIYEYAVVGIDYENANDFLLERLEYDRGDSGWFVGDYNTSLDYSLSKNLKKVSVYELMLNANSVIPYLAFPINSVVILEKSKKPYIQHNNVELAYEPSKRIE